MCEKWNTYRGVSGIFNDGRWKILHVHYLELVLSAHVEREQG